MVEFFENILHKEVAPHVITSSALVASPAKGELGGMIVVRTDLGGGGRMR